ncbi:protein kinase, partial [Trypanosoma cruzi]
TANIVVEAARKYGGGVDVFLPELFNLNFPRRGDSHLDKLDATFCAIEIHRNLPDAVRRCCAILVDSGVFHFGICGGPEKKEPVLWGRATSTELIHVQRRYGVSLAILQNTVPFIRSRVHVLPFASVLVDSADMSSKVTFHIVIEDIVNEGSWQCVEETYLNGFRYLTAQACTEARMCFESLVASPYVTPQLMRLLRCQIAQVQQCDVKKRSRFPSEWRVGGSDRVDTLTSKFSPASVDNSESIVSGLHPPSLTFCGSRRRLTPSALSTSASSTHVSSAGQAIAHEFWDKKNVRWKRASENFPESGRFPVFLGISDTGTLAALKFIPVSSLPDCGYNDMESLDLALTRAQTLYHENLVQLLGYGQTKEHMCLIMEYVPGGTLRDTVRRYGRALPLMAIKRFLVGILRGLEYLHDRGLVHGNLRPEDVMAAVEGLYKLRGVSMACTAEAAAAMTEERLRA